MMAVGQVGPYRLVVRTSLFQGGSGDSTSPGGKVPRKEVNRGLSINLEFFLPGSMPERLMGTDCKFVDDMSTLVQIQLGPLIRHSHKNDVTKSICPLEVPDSQKGTKFVCNIPFFFLFLPCLDLVIGNNHRIPRNPVILTLVFIHVQYFK